jgi:oligopeptide transport system ATP-binding protein
MRQRVMIAMAIALEPSLLIADEPTTALDVTIQAQIMELLLSLARERRMALMLITHDVRLAAEAADRVAVMYAGRVVETGRAASTLSAPHHPYTRGLVAALPRRAGEGRLTALPGAPPVLRSEPAGCAFAPRCAVRRAICPSKQPPAVDTGDGGISVCFATAEEQS